MHLKHKKKREGNNNKHIHSTVISYRRKAIDIVFLLKLRFDKHCWIRREEI